MSIYNEIFKIVKNYETELLYDIEAPSHWYAIAYKDNKVILQEIDKYTYDGDEWGEICTKTNVSKITEIECTIEEYCYFLIIFFNKKIDYCRYEYPAENYILSKIEIVNRVI